MKTIVVSAVNINRGGPLTILRDCLEYLSQRAQREPLRVIAIVYKKDLANFPEVEYIETQWPKKRWVNRLWYEYVSLKKMSKELAPVDLWFSLHDTTPNVVAKRRAVYCHNSFSFYKWGVRDLMLAPKIALFAIFTKNIYRKNIYDNDYLVVQQYWFKKAMSDLFTVNLSKIIVAPPPIKLPTVKQEARLVQRVRNDQKLKQEQPSSDVNFLFPATADSHKNFEIICRACELLEKKMELKGFKVLLTITGNENKYTRWLHEKWGDLASLDFIGYLKKDVLLERYAEVDCLVFPSKVETWGLPITEFAGYDKPMLLADLPYARETAGGCDKVAFFDPDEPAILAHQMDRIIKSDSNFLTSVPKTPSPQPVAGSWEGLFAILEDPNQEIKRELR